MRNGPDYYIVDVPLDGCVGERGVSDVQPWFVLVAMRLVFSPAPVVIIASLVKADSLVRPSHVKVLHVLQTKYYTSLTLSPFETCY